MVMLFGEYQAIAHQTSLVDTFADPQRKISDGILEESLEAIACAGVVGQHSYLMGMVRSLPQEGMLGIAKEFGDVLWYTSEHQTRAGITLDSLALSAIKRHTGYSLAPDSLRIVEFDLIASRFAQNYTVIDHKEKHVPQTNTKLPEVLKRSLIEITVASRPGYVLQRVLNRLLANIDYDRWNIPGAASNVDFDPPEDLENAASDMLWVMSVVGQNKLGYGLNDIARMNLDKVLRRKENDTLLEGEDADRQTDI